MHYFFTFYAIKTNQYLYKHNYTCTCILYRYIHVHIYLRCCIIVGNAVVPDNKPPSAPVSRCEPRSPLLPQPPTVHLAPPGGGQRAGGAHQQGDRVGAVGNESPYLSVGEGADRLPIHLQEPVSRFQQFPLCRGH